MKSFFLLSTLVAATAAVAQTRTPTTPPVIPAATLQNVQVQDPKLVQIQKQLSDLQAQVNELKAQNAKLTQCVAGLKHELDDLKKPKPVDDGVSVGKPAGLGAIGCL